MQIPILHFEHVETLKLPLIKRFYKQHYPSAKPKSDELIISAYENHHIKAVVRFRSIADYRLLTGMAVVSEERSKGIGQALLIYCKKNILKHNDYCFAYPHLTSFYTLGNFYTQRPDQLPAELRTLLTRYQASGKSLIPMIYKDDLC
ncbi:GNAT family N-acetyltransferase [Vibrio metschnikovii]|nr:GNAT family N-acetyltransferase [Vibrio metschnikovii]EKO3928887.1 GNAT family N-acetyltransferase [Vibrio metschnikovii]